MRTTLPITGNMREQLEYRGLALETAFVDDGPPETVVMVFHVELFPGTRSVNLAVVNF